MHRRYHQHDVPARATTDPVVVEEPAMFGGFHSFPRFNHTIAESLGRLWTERTLRHEVGRIAFLAR